VNAYEVEAGIGVIAVNTVWSMPERLECVVLQKARYINTLTYLPTYLPTYRNGVQLIALRALSRAAAPPLSPILTPATSFTTVNLPCGKMDRGAKFGPCKWPSHLAAYKEHTLSHTSRTTNFVETGHAAVEEELQELRIANNVVSWLIDRPNHQTAFFGLGQIELDAQLFRTFRIYFSFQGVTRTNQ